ncbi:peptide/nickel transport system permease protein [Myceligenerans xiligouense]|uniref:Peptide/nickel transport system permease protein n=1 Tax=Myceligenerans xiligouense TaxID=253184 RepID=A0A3N4ZJX0_9MICO|nr:peptide/nickel transport system permease protein [Myceligenerans xiligouense]
MSTGELPPTSGAGGAASAPLHEPASIHGADGGASGADHSGEGVWRRAWRTLRRNPVAIAGFAIVAAFVLVAVLAPLIAPYGPHELPGRSDVRPTSIPGPSAEYWLGLDRYGGDVFSKLIWGARASLLVGVVSTLFGLTGGMLIGLLAGWFGRWVDFGAMRLVDLMLSVPSLLLAVSIAAIAGQSQMSVIIAIGVVQVPIFARLLRGSMLAQRGQDYVLAASALGLTRRSVTMSHVLPNSVGPVIVQATLTLATAVIEAAALSFLGLGGGEPSTAEWGRMLTAAQQELAVAPRLAVLPGICIAVTALGFTLVGESLREALDPRNRTRR